MGRFSYEKNIPRWSKELKGTRASPKNQFKNLCSTCGGSLPCKEEECKRAQGKKRYENRKKK